MSPPPWLVAVTWLVGVPLAIGMAGLLAAWVLARLTERRGKSEVN